jgi:hypothetical protein
MAEKVKAKKGTPPSKHVRYNEEFKRNAVDMRNVSMIWDTAG